MPIDQYGRNLDYVDYFPLDEYVKRITLLPYVLEHLEDTNHNFNEYVKKIASYDENYAIDYWIYLLYEELKYNQQIEHIDFQKINLMDDEVFFNTLTVSNKRIHELHNFVTAGQYEPSFEYRKTDVNVSNINSDGTQDIFWRGARHQDVERFMADFIKIYKHSDVSLIMSNPFLKSSLIHLLFIRIHPYVDGNGRTARLLHNSKFTEIINRVYNTRLKISPLNLSQSILLNKPTYIKALDNIYFDVKHDTNDAINYWFDIMLNMADEQIFLSSNKLDDIDSSFLKDLQCETDEVSMNKAKKKMRVNNLHKK